jgi:hypothetical protein
LIGLTVSPPYSGCAWLLDTPFRITSDLINLVPVKTKFSFDAGAIRSHPPFSPRLDVMALTLTTLHLSCISSVMRRIDAPKIGGGCPSTPPKTLLHLGNRSGELFSVHYCASRSILSCAMARSLMISPKVYTTAGFSMLCSPKALTGCSVTNRANPCHVRCFY